MPSSFRRLTLRKEPEFFLNAKRVYSPYLTVAYIFAFSHKEADETQSAKKDKIMEVAVSVSKKVSLLAVKRNKLKRQIVEILREVSQSPNFNNALKVVVLPKAKALELSFSDLKKQTEYLLKKA